MVIVSGFHQRQSTVQILVADMVEHKNNGATVNTITDYSMQLFIEEIVICDKKPIGINWLASIKLIKQRLNTNNVRDKWNDLQTRLRKMREKKYSMIKWRTAMRYLTNYSKIIHWCTRCSFFMKAFSSKTESENDGKIQNKKKKRSKNLIQKSEIFSELRYWEK